MSGPGAERVGAGLRRRPWFGYLLAAGVTAAMIAARLALTDVIPDEPALIIFLIPILLAAYVGGIGPGLFATALGALATAYFLLLPAYDLRIERPIDVLRWALFITVGVLISVLNEALHRARHAAMAGQRDRSELRGQLAAIAASMPGLISTFRLRPDGSGCMPYNSPRFHELYGIDPALVVDDAAPLLALIHPDDGAAVRETLIESARTMTPWHVQYRVQNPERGQRWLETWSMPTREADGSLAWSGYVVDISDRKRLEEALRESEERFRRALRGANDGLWDWDLTTDQVFYSPRWKSMLGYREEELGAHIDTWKRLVHPDDLAAALSGVATGIRRGAHQFEIEFRMRHRDGHWVDILSRALLVRDGDGTPRRLVGTHVDISARKCTEQELRDRQSLLQATLESTADGILVVDRAGRISAFNARFAELWRLPIDLLERRNDDEALAAVLAQLADPQRFLDKVRELYAQPEASSFDGVEFLDGRVFERASHPQRIGDQIVGRVWSFRDVTARCEAEAALRRSEEQLRLITDSLPALITYVDTAYRCRSVNRVCERWFGRIPDRVVGRDVRELLGPAAWAEAGPLVERALAGETVAVEREVRVGGLPARWLQMTLTPDRDAAGGVRGLVGLAHDITERKRAEESYLRSTKLEALGTLSAGIAHDFNNILLAINGNARLAATDLPGDHPAQASLGHITRAGARAADLVRQILAFSRADVPQRTPLDLGPVVHEAIQLVRAILPPLVEVRSEVGAPLPTVAADATQVHEIIVNLVTNAADAIGPDGGRVDVRLDPVEIDDRHADRALGLTPARYVCLTVSDTGRGMEPALAERIFDPFFTTKAPGQGTGLGLSVVHGIITSYGGGLAVESAVGRGTTFRLYFPIGAGAAPSLAPPPAQEPRGHGERVLYVDDDDMLVTLVCRLLTKLGYRITGASDPTAVLRDFRADPRAFDVVVTDLSMPGMSGIRLARELLAVRPDLPIVMTTGYVRPGDEQAVQECGVRALILKPDTVDELGVVLDATLRGRPAAPRAAAAGGDGQGGGTPH